MVLYIIPLLALIFNFAGFAFCIKFLLSKRWRYWVMPVIFSLGLIIISIICTVNIALEGSVPEIVTFAFNISIILAIIGFLWIWCVLLFSFGLKKENFELQENPDADDSESANAASSVANDFESAGAASSDADDSESANATSSDADDFESANAASSDAANSESASAASSDADDFESASAASSDANDFESASAASSDADDFESASAASSNAAHRETI